MANFTLDKKWDEKNEKKLSKTNVKWQWVKELLGSSGVLALFSMTCLLFLSSYILIRGSFLLWNWGLFKNSSLADILLAFLIGLRFDLSAIGFVLVPLFLVSLLGSMLSPLNYRRVLFGFSLLLQVPLWVINFIDLEFFNFVGRRMTFSGLFILKEAQGKVAGFFETYWLGISLIILFLFIFIFLLKKLFFSTIGPVFSKKIFLLSHLLLLIPLVLMARGGIQEKPIDFVYANVFNNPVLNNLVLNSTFSILKSSDKDRVSHVQFFSKEEEYFSLLNGYQEKKSLLDGTRLKKKQNVVIFILESFALEFMGKPNKQVGYTPFLDELIDKSLFFKNAFANGRRSIEGVCSVMAGIPAMMSEPFISSEFSSNYFLGLGSLLEPQGYSTSFYHGGNNGTMYFDSFIKSAGIPKYVGASEYPNKKDHDKVWGIFDEPFFKYFGQQLGYEKKPFVAGIFSLSSHHPYTLPVEFKDHFKKGPLEILESIQYTDYALRKFFETYSHESWFKDTLFIFTADHTQKNLLPEFNNELGRFRVPILFYHPQYNWPKVDTEQPVQHIDIVPSIMDFLDLPQKQKILLSESVFKSSNDKSVTLYSDGNYYFVTKKWILSWNESRKNSSKLFISSDVALKNEIIDLSHQEMKSELEKRLKASIQYFNKGLWDNRLYFPSK